MATPRIAPAEPPYSPAVAEVLAKLTPAGKEPLKLFRTLAHNPRVMRRLFDGSLLDQGSIEAKEREIVILRTCARCRSQYEWGVHVALFARRVGLTDKQTAATWAVPMDKDDWSDRELVLIRLADELHESATVSAALWQDVVSHYATEQILELIALAGFYHTISFVTNSVQVDGEAFAPR
jgi:alkylhydroperoxidase family enzyme